MRVIFLQSGESPDFGAVLEGEERDLDEETAKVLKERGVVKLKAKTYSPPAPSGDKT